jgi:hypothetical protein
MLKRISANVSNLQDEFSMYWNVSTKITCNLPKKTIKQKARKKTPGQAF